MLTPVLRAAFPAVHWVWWVAAVKLVLLVLFVRAGVQTYELVTDWLPRRRRGHAADGDEALIRKGLAPRTVWVTRSDDDGETWHFVPADQVTHYVDNLGETVLSVYVAE